MARKFGYEITDEGKYRLVRSEADNEDFYIPFRSITFKHRFIEYKSLKSLEKFCEKHGINLIGKVA